MERVVGVLSALVFAAGVISAVGYDDDSSAVVSQVSPPTSTGPVVFGDPLPPSAPTALREGERTGGLGGEPVSTTSSTAAPTTAAPAADSDDDGWPALPGDGVARAILTPTGVVAAVEQDNGDGTYVVFSPCGNSVTAPGRPLTGAHVVLDPGHGGSEPGAVGPSGLLEKDVNLAVAAQAIRQLESQGAVVVVTRTADYRMTIESRSAVARALGPVAFVSIHHNAEPDGSSVRPGSETYFQIGSESSRRLAGLLVEEYRKAFADFDVEWAADTDAGAKFREGADGGDYYGILARSAGVTAVLSEAAYVSNPSEERLLVEPAFHLAEGAAISRAVNRLVFTDDPGSGFIDPYERDTPAGGGGGSDGCVDPPMS